jgi:transposase InsO family protein
MHRVPHAVSCGILGVSLSWFYKWINRRPTPRQARRADLDIAVKDAFDASKATYGSPRIHADLVEAGWTVSVNTVADSMRRQGLQGRKPKRRRGLTRQDRSAPKFPDLLHRDFTAAAPNVKWCGDITEIPTDEGKLYLASVLDLHSRRLLASATSEHPDAGLACDAIKMAATVRGGRAAIDGVIFHTDRGSTYTATSFTTLCRKLGVSQSMGRVGSCFDNAAAEAFFSTLEHEVLSRHHFTTKAQARQVVVAWCQDFYNRRRRHSSAALMSPIQYERLAADQPAAA